MTPEIMRQYLTAHAPELEVVELPQAHTTEYIAREWNVLPAQVAKTLTLRVGGDAIIVVTRGDSRLDNRKVKEELGGKGHLMPGSEASEITGHPVWRNHAALPRFLSARILRHWAKAFRGGRDRRGLDPRSHPNPAHSICSAHRRHVGRCLQRDVSQWRTGSNDSSIAHVTCQQ